MKFKIHNIQELAIYVFIIAFILYGIFRIFHYYYKDNYCDVFSAVVLENSKEEFQAMKKCVYTLVCDIGPINRIVYGSTHEGLPVIGKDFICIRKYPAGTWK